MLADEESFIVLGSTPSNSMTECFSDSGDGGQQQWQESLMASSTSQTFSNHSSAIQGDESASKSTALKSMQSVQGRSTPPPRSNASELKSLDGSDLLLAASILRDDTKPSLLDAFPSLMHSTMPIDEIKMPQHLGNEHEQLKESVQEANVAMKEKIIDNLYPKKRRS